MSHGSDSTAHIIQSLVVNLAIAMAKAVAAFFTRSGSMLAEAIHSFADCGNQLLLLRGVKQARLPPDEKHPLGYGRNLYFWSFIVALLLFSGGGVFSIYEGILHLRHPEPIQNIALALGILGFALLLEGWATFGNIRELNTRRGTVPFLKFLRETKDSDLVVIFGENSAAVLGLLIALTAILLARLTGHWEFDGIGSLLVGVVLVGVAIFLGVEVKSLLVGESADPLIKSTATQLAIDHPKIEKLLSCITVQQGPGEVFVAIKVQVSRNSMSADALIEAINEYEDALRAAHPQVQWSFVEPDFGHGKGREAFGRAGTVD